MALKNLSDALQAAKKKAGEKYEDELNRYQKNYKGTKTVTRLGLGSVVDNNLDTMKRSNVGNYFLKSLQKQREEEKAKTAQASKSKIPTDEEISKMSLEELRANGLAD